jgi:Transglutaminase-like superfamily
MRRISFLLAIFCSLVLVFLFVFRAEFYGWTEIESATIGSLYPVAHDAVAISGLKSIGSGFIKLFLVNAEKCTKWSVSTSSGKSEIVSGGNPRFSLYLGEIAYILRPLNCALNFPRIESIKLDIFYGAAADFKHLAVPKDQIQLNSANIPWLKVRPVSFDRWVPVRPQGTADELERTRSMLAKAGFNSEASTREKIEFLVKFVQARMPNGSPDEYLYHLSPFGVLKEVESRRSGAFCFQFSLVYAYLANAVGVPTRNVFTGGADQDVDLGSHAFSESYVAEDGRWALVDPTNNIAFVKNHSGSVLSGAEVYMAINSGGLEGLVARSLSKGTYSSIGFNRVSAGLEHFIHRENFLIYVGSLDSRYQHADAGGLRYFRKLKRFLTQPQQYFGYTHFVSYFWLRPFFFLASIFFWVFWFCVFAFDWFRRRSRARLSAGA